MRFVAGFAFDQRGAEVLLVRKNRPAWQAGKLNGVGGKIELGEASAYAMAREFQEETGLRVDPERWRLFCTLEHDGNDVMFFTANLSEHELRSARTMETEDVRAYAVNYMLIARQHELMPNLLWMLPLARSASRETAHVKDPSPIPGGST